MTFEQRVQALLPLGFTPRQAAFLTTVMLHSGVCLLRHYTKFCGIAYGQTTRDFFARLTNQQFATPHTCWRRGGAYYHVHHKGLYRAIGEPDNRHRRPPTIPRAAERLMLLDIVLEHPYLRWLATEQDKVSYFVEQRHLSPADLPSVTFGETQHHTVRYFTDKLPIGLGPRLDEVTFIYLVTALDVAPFKRFLTAHRRLLHLIRCWTLRLVFPRVLATCRPIFEHVADDLFAPPLRLSVVDEFRWYCHARRTIEQSTSGLQNADEERYKRARHAFGAQRFYDAYRGWLRDGDASLNALLSPLLHEASQRGDVRVVSDVLPHRYLDLAATVTTA